MREDGKKSDNGIGGRVLRLRSGGFQESWGFSFGKVATEEEEEGEEREKKKEVPVGSRNWISFMM